MSEFVEVKTADLVGAALDWAVAKVEGVELALVGAYPHAVVDGRLLGNYRPSTSWSQGGPLIEKHGIRLERSRDGHSWFAGWMFSASGWNARYETFDGEDESGSSSALVATCRAIVASVLGETVSVPKELLS
ncbi:phage protein NinX family protein [Pseudomonas syringae]|uniref:phage protein NinX family protein n=1 Tax=Pseudomonas syringae TaxID=317 RepID=UPI0002ADC6BF|nr:phage protein NinX family protein [Pseudomonas syringae]ELS43301.1 Prophage PSSB64-03, Orf38 [Pseudomonas syringae pv. syringae B64]